MLPLERELKTALKEDLWNILNKEKLANIDFYKEVFNQLLGSKEINLIFVKNIANRIESEYKYALAYFYDKLEKGMYLEVIEPIKSTMGLFCKKVTPTLQQLKDNKKTYEIAYGKVKRR